MRTYAEAAAHLLKGRDKDQRPLTGRSTILIRRDAHTIAVRYHATDVVTYHDDGRITLNSGGWRSMTTKERFGEYAPRSVAQVKGVWYMWYPGDKPAALYFDGIEMDESGALLNAKPIEETAKLEHAKRTIDRMVKRYIAGFEAEARKAGALEQPSGGDCWICMTSSTEAEHLLSHLEEEYFVPTLLVNAIQERGYRDVATIWYMINADIKSGRADLFHLTNSLRMYFRTRKIALAEALMAQAAEEAA